MIPLAVHSGYSFLQGTSGVDALVGHAAALGHKRLALTDTDNLCGLWPFLAACRDHGVTPMVGAEVTEPATSRRAVCLVKDVQGYAGLCRLLTRRHMRVDFDLASGLALHGNGMVVLAEDPDLLHAGHEANLDMVAAMLGRPLPADHLLCRAARRLEIPLAAAPAVFFNRPEDFEIHRVLRAIGQNTTLSRLTPEDTVCKDAFLAAPRQYMRRFAACPQAVLQNAAIAERIGF
ncbi:MAG: PHP domain-containing protein, partial [Desulfobacterales bacterium]|nr:PHP domain-containing protein [Desulfobacterales bacterium]